MFRKRSSSYFEQVKHVCKDKGYLPLHKFQGLSLSEAINLVSHYLPDHLTFFPFSEGADFEFGVEGLSNIMQAFPPKVSNISFNVRYLLMMEEYALIALIKAVPNNIACVMLDYKDEYDEFPASDFLDHPELKNPDVKPNVQSLKMLISTFNDHLAEGIQLSYDFKKYGLEEDTFGLMRSANMHLLFAGPNVDIEEVDVLEEKDEVRLVKS